MKEVLVSDGISSDSVRKKMLSINALHNINVFLVDSNWKTVYSTQNNIENTYRWLQHFIFSGDRDIELIKENDNYSIKKAMIYLRAYHIWLYTEAWKTVHSLLCSL